MITSRQYKRIMAGLREQRKRILSSEEEARKLLEELGIGHLYVEPALRKKRPGRKSSK